MEETENMARCVVWHDGLVSRCDRNRAYDHASGLIWFTGLSASGKSTIAHRVEKELFDLGYKTYVLDGDNIRHGLNAGLGFSPEDRRENIRRIGEVSKLMADAGIIVLAAFVSPCREDREQIRRHFDGDNFMEVYVRCSLPECEKRDPKGFYRKARAGIIGNYTGISAPYEEPENPELVIDTEALDIEASVGVVLDFMRRENFFLIRQPSGERQLS